MSWMKTIENNMKLIGDLCGAIEASGEQIDVQTAVRVIGLYEENQKALIDALKYAFEMSQRLNNELLEEKMKNMKLQMSNQMVKT